MSRKESVMAFLEIRAGEGGDDAKLFINDMLRMYQKYCVSHGIQCSLESKMDGIAVLSINGDIRDLMKYETGVHRIQRVPQQKQKAEGTVRPSQSPSSKNELVNPRLTRRIVTSAFTVEVVLVVSTETRLRLACVSSIVRPAPKRVVVPDDHSTRIAAERWICSKLN